MSDIPLRCIPTTMGPKTVPVIIEKTMAMWHALLGGKNFVEVNSFECVIFLLSNTPSIKLFLLKACLRAFVF